MRNADAIGHGLARVEERLDAIERRLDRLAQQSDVLLERSRRTWFQRLLFRSSGKPRRLVRTILFHKSGKPRGIVRKHIVHSDGTPRRSFAPWMASSEYRALRWPAAMRSTQGTDDDAVIASHPLREMLLKQLRTNLAEPRARIIADAN